MTTLEFLRHPDARPFVVRTVLQTLGVVQVLVGLFVVGHMLFQMGTVLFTGAPFGNVILLDMLALVLLYFSLSPLDARVARPLPEATLALMRARA